MSDVITLARPTQALGHLARLCGIIEIRAAQDAPFVPISCRWHTTAGHSESVAEAAASAGYSQVRDAFVRKVPAA